MLQSRMPYQCMVRLENVLLAARGSSIDSLSLSDGALLSTWTCPVTPHLPKSKKQAPESIGETSSKSVLEKPHLPSVEVSPRAEPPGKKRRISKDEDDSGSKNGGEKQEVENVAGEKIRESREKENNRSDAISSGLEAPAVIALAVTGDGKHAVAVTGEDKSIRVFETISQNGQHSLKQISQRPMPKRPCSLTISFDSSIIISADKFGDVYSLPLIYSENLATTPPISAVDPIVPEPKTFAPAANEFTIHSLRNLKALENQRRQPAPIPTLPAITHSHDLLLGHVSMLTDVLLASLEGRQYIITADRDEHIRISRGVPQTHIIEGYCLGHTEFVSRLCIPDTHPEVLISGGGDEELFVWEWLTGRLLSKVNIATHVNQVLKREGDAKIKPAIQTILHSTFASSAIEITVVTCESVPALFIFALALSPNPTLQHVQTVHLPGNPLSVILRGNVEAGILVSIDTIHKSGSPADSNEKHARRQERERREEEDIVDSVLFLKVDGDALGFGEAFVKAAEIVDVETEKTTGGNLGNLLYNLENLRKREGDGEE